MADHEMTTDDVWTKIEAEHICLFATLDDDAIKARPMAPMVSRADRVIWFMTDRASHKVQVLEGDSAVTLMFQNSASNWYLSISGSGSVVDDRIKVRELWSDALKQWFEGPDDPKLVLIAFEPNEADYWDGPNRLIAGLKMLVTAVTGAKTDMGNAGKVLM